MSEDGPPAGWLAGHVAPLRGEGRGWVLLTVAGGWFATLGLRYVIPGLLPRIKDTFGISNAAAGVAVTVIWLTYAGMQLPAGALIGRIGERILLTVSLLVAGASLLLFGILPTYALFLVTATLFGLATGLFGPPRGTVLSNTFRANDGAAFGATLAAGSIGAAVLPFVATTASSRLDGSFGSLAGWQLALAGFAPLFLALAVGIWWAVPGRNDRAADQPTDTSGCDNPAPDGGRTATVLGAATQRPVVVAALGGAIMLFTFQGLSAFYTTYLVEQKGISTATAGALFALLFVAGAICQSAAGRAADQYGHSRVLTGIAILGIPPLIALPLVDGRLALAALTIPLGLRLAMGPVLNAYVISVLPSAVEGTAWGLVRTCFFAVGSLGSVAVGAVADLHFDAAIYGLAVLTVPAIAIFWYLPDCDAVAG
ncbi:MAG: MFS transporter [Halorientalis sp.]